MALKIGFIGLGRMGGGMARNLAKAGFSLMVYDRCIEARQRFEGFCSVTSEVNDLFAFCEVLMLSLPASEQVEETIGAFLKTGVAGKTVIDLGTSFPPSTIKLAQRINAAGGAMLDAPLGGGPLQAETGALTVMVGGDEGVFQKYRDIFQAIGKKIFYVGESGTGHTVKLTSNYLSILYSALYAEILPFAQKLGLKGDKIFEVITACGANSPIFQLAAPRMLHDRYDKSFQMDLAIKDLTYMRRLFDEQHVPSPLLDAGLNLFRTAECQGLSKGDTTEVARVNKRLLGLEN